MADVRISCAGARVGALALPPFVLRAGEAVCLHLPVDASADSEGKLIGVLTGGRATPGYRTFGRVVAAEAAADWRNPLLRLFRPMRASVWLRRRAWATRDEATAALRRAGLERDWPLSRLAGNPRLLLALEAARMAGAEAVVFGTAGCDPAGVQVAFAAVASRLEACPAVYLSRPFLQCGAFHRSHFPAATCVEWSEASTPPRRAETA